MKPSDVFKRHFLNCFIDDAFGLKNIDSLNEDMVSYECDYPHSDTLWPEVPERLHETIKHLTDTQIDKITHGNAMRFFRFDMLKHHRSEEHTFELQSLMRISYAVFCLKKKTKLQSYIV